MEHLVWVKWGQLDRALDRTTWVEMTRALRDLGIRTTLVTSYERSPVALSDSVDVQWIPPTGGRGLKRASFGFQALARIESIQRRDPADFIVVDWASFYASFPTDVLARLGLRHTAVIMDMRTFEFGFFGNEWSRMDQLLYANARLACVYNGVMHTGFSAIVAPLRNRAQAMGASSRTVIWGSGFSVPDETAVESEADRRILSEVEGFVSGRTAMVFHGVLADNRGLDTALRVMAQLNGDVQNLAFVMVGTGALQGRLIETIRTLGLTDTCRVFSPLAHRSIPALLRMADLGCMVYPDIEYWRYNHPIKLVEYLSVGVPVLVTRTPVFTENFAGYRGLVYPNENTDSSLVQTLHRIAADPAQLVPLGSAAAKDAENLRWACHAQRFAAFLRDGPRRAAAGKVKQ